MNDKYNICPRCGKYIESYPALSRKDNKTKICSDCGTAEALESYIKYIHNKEL